MNSAGPFSTMKAYWYVECEDTVCEEGSLPNRKTVATFLNYQDCYCFMQGIAVAVGLDFNKTDPRNRTYTDKERFVRYKIYSGYLYKGANQ